MGIYYRFLWHKFSISCIFYKLTSKVFVEHLKTAENSSRYVVSIDDEETVHTATIYTDDDIKKENHKTKIRRKKKLVK
jgi:hypothetical protein